MFATLSWFFTASASASSSGLQNLCEATTIVVGWAVGRHSYVGSPPQEPASRVVYTDVRLSTPYVLYGLARPFLDLTVEGGVADGVRMVNFHHPALELGDAYLLFLSESNAQVPGAVEVLYFRHVPVVADGPIDVQSWEHWGSACQSRPNGISEREFTVAARAVSNGKTWSAALAELTTPTNGPSTRDGTPPKK